VGPGDVVHAEEEVEYLDGDHDVLGCFQENHWVIKRGEIISSTLIRGGGGLQRGNDQ
jgi:hypothetical protein